MGTNYKIGLLASKLLARVPLVPLDARKRFMHASCVEHGSDDESILSAVNSLRLLRERVEVFDFAGSRRLYACFAVVAEDVIELSHSTNSATDLASAPLDHSAVLRYQRSAIAT